MDQTDANLQANILTLERTIFAMLATGVRMIDFFWEHPDIMASHPPAEPPERFWWRASKPTKEGEEEAPGIWYISLDPGEFRTERPAGVHDVVFDLPPPSDSNPISSRLSRIIEDIEYNNPASDDELGYLLKIGREVLATREDELNEDEGAYRSFLECVAKLDKDPLPDQDMERELYKKYFYRLQQFKFCSSMAIIGIMLRVDLEKRGSFNSIVGDPLAGLLEFHTEHREEILVEAIKLTNHHYNTAKETLERALSSLTLRLFYKLLYWAHHHFFFALILGRNSELAGDPRLGYNSHIAEEGCAACVTGLGLWLDDFIDGRELSLEQEIAELFRDGQGREADKLARRVAIPSNPVFPRHWAAVTKARAMVKARGDWLTKGLEALLALEQEYNERQTAEEMLCETEERSRLEQGLIEAYRESGNLKEAERHAAGLAVRLLMQHVLRPGK